MLSNHGVSIFIIQGQNLYSMGYHKANPEYKGKTRYIYKFKKMKKCLTLPWTMNLTTRNRNQDIQKRRWLSYLEEYGIGRPSTYAETNRIPITCEKNTLKKEKQSFVPEQGKLTSEQLDLPSFCYHDNAILRKWKKCSMKYQWRSSK